MHNFVIHKAANSLDLLEKSIEKGVSSVEGDLHMTKDNVLVFCNSYSLHINGKAKLFRDYSLQEIYALKGNHGLNDEVIPFEDVLEICDKSALTLVVDIKSGPIYYQNFCQKIVNTSHKYRNKIDIYFMSYDHSIPMKLKEDNSFHHKSGLLFSAKLVNLKETIRMTNSDFFQTNNFFLTEHELKIAEEESQEVIGWCSPNFEEIKLNIKRQLSLITIDFEMIDSCHSYIKTIK